jgi:hypothetical protein
MSHSPSPFIGPHSSINHLKLLGARRLSWSKVHSHDQPVLDATVKKTAVARGIYAPLGQQVIGPYYKQLKS